MKWIIDNLGTVITFLVLAATVVSIVLYLIRNKKQGKSSCGGSCGGACSGCAMSGTCHSTGERK